jgi:phage terminase large subunit-like protein
VAQKPRIALVGESFADARAVMVEGVSGLLAVHPPDERPSFEVSKRQVTWPNGAIAQLFSAEDRGFRDRTTHAWCDELANGAAPTRPGAALASHGNRAG